MLGIIERLQKLEKRVVDLYNKLMKDGGSGESQNLQQTLENGNVASDTSIIIEDTDEGHQVEIGGRYINLTYPASTLENTRYGMREILVRDEDGNSNGGLTFGVGKFFFPVKNSNTNYTIATLDDVISPDLQQVLDTGNSSTTELNIRSISDPAIGITVRPNTISIDTPQGALSAYSNGITHLNPDATIETNLNIGNRIATGTANYSFDPNKDANDYIIATTSDIPTILPVSETQSGIVDNISLQELGGVDKYINGVRIGKGNNTASTSNTVIGSNALMASTTATSNTAIGRSTLALATTGSFNTAVGAVSLANLTTGTQNVGLGGGALRNLTTGGFNLGIGTNALVNNITGIRNTAIGAGTGIAVTGNNNTAIGYLAMGMSNVVSTGELNIALGFQAGGQLTSGSGNILIENQQLFASTITTGSGNVILKQGLASTGVTTGNNNTVIGNVTGLPTDASNLALLSDGSGNIAIRKEADNSLLAPTLTNALIDSGGVKSLVTKEYLTEHLKLKGYTVATLPVGTIGDNAYVTDALTPTYLGIVIGGGAVTCKVFFNGTNWIT